MQKCFLMLFLIMCLFSCESAEKVVSVKKNAPVQAQLKNPNVTYVIEDEVNLRGDTVYIPSNSMLQFKRGGALTNGTIKGNNTLIEGAPNFDKVRFIGAFKNQKYKTSWCSQDSMSDYIEDVMNLSDNSAIIVDCDITLADKKRYVNHLTLIGENKTVINSDRYNVTYGGAEISNLKFRWNKKPVIEPTDNYAAVIVYHHLLEKDTIINILIENVDADGGRYCSFFMRQYKSSIQPKLQAVNRIRNSSFCDFTRGAIWTCGGSGSVENCEFRDIGYDLSKKLWSVTALRLGYDTRPKAKAIGYNVENCLFYNLVAAYNPDNDGRELHGLLAYGDSIVVRNNGFSTLSTSFSNATDTGRDSEMLYIKGSYNEIEGNSFENGAGAASDGVVTLKVGKTEGNVVRNNSFITSNTTSKFVYLGGHNHLIEGNEFMSSCSLTKDKYVFAIYLGHYDNVIESVIIRNNTFYFNGKTNYMAVYANQWEDLSLTGNVFNNLTKLLKCNNRNGRVVIKDNTFTIEAVKGSSEDCFIEIKGNGKYQAVIESNKFVFNNSTLGILLRGSNFRFGENQVLLNKSSLQALLHGSNTEIEVVNNTFTIDQSTVIRRKALIGVKETPNTIINGNVFTGSPKKLF